MPFVDQAVNAAIGLGMAKLHGTTGNVVNLAATLARRINLLSGNTPFTPKGVPGARDPLSAGRARSDPLMNYNWYCDLPTIDGVTLGWEFVEEATLPLVEFEPMSNYRAGKMYHYPGHYSIGTLNLKLYEDSHGSATTFVDAWQRKIINLESGLYNTPYGPNGFKKKISFTLLDVAKLTVMFVEYTGCWPSRPDSISLGSASSDRVVLSVEFSVDEMRLKFGKFDSAQIPSVIDTIGADFPPKLSSLPIKFPGNFVDVSIGSLNSAANSAINTAKSAISGVTGFLG